MKRTNHCKRTQKKSLMIEMMTGYGAWCHTNVCGLVRHTGRLRYLCISAEGFFWVINLVCGRIWSLACTVLLTTIRNGPQFFLFLFIYWQKTRNCPQFFSGRADIASMAKPLKPHAFTFIKLSRFLIQCLLISDNFWPTVIIKVFCLKNEEFLSIENHRDV